MKDTFLFKLHHQEQLKFQKKKWTTEKEKMEKEKKMRTGRKR